ncbi:MAG: oxygen-independent coproporphyrinogen III oxidase [Clostridiales bacterium]|nr:oxygen-independent coproporphyrinogen III oxidase [Clostridiales bacterium]
MKNKKELGIYVHIPFCVRKCKYCDFLSISANKNVWRTYLDALLCEIRTGEVTNNIVAADYEVVTIFFGGGTPSIIPGEWIKEVMSQIKNIYHVSDSAEVTIESNPESITIEKLMQYKEAGINRLSIGLQSTNNKELEILGRVHTYEKFLEGYEKARKCGFDNINIDLMSALPKQSKASWEETLDKVLKLSPEHISAYSLIVEEGTPFYEQKDVLDLPTEDDEREMYYETEKQLETYSYKRYEISNYAKEGFECKHNIGYWQRKDYLGFGAGAASCVEERRFNNISDIDKYSKHLFVKENSMCLSRREQIEEFMFLGLRLMEGIEIKKFKEEFNCSIFNIYGKVIDDLEAKDLNAKNEDRIYLTKLGIDVSNYVLSEFLLDESFIVEG